MDGGRLTPLAPWSSSSAPAVAVVAAVASAVGQPMQCLPGEAEFVRATKPRRLLRCQPPGWQRIGVRDLGMGSVLASSKCMSCSQERTSCWVIPSPWPSWMREARGGDGEAVVVASTVAVVVG